MSLSKSYTGQNKSRVDKKKLSRSLGTSMWFWSVSLSDQLSGQFLIFLGWPKKIAQSQRPGNFLSTLLNFLSSLFWKLVTLWYLDWKKNEESEQNMNCPVSETAQFFFLAEQKNEILTGQLVGQETDQNHMDVPTKGLKNL